ncbi:MAG: sulfatase [Thermoplasmata archaeon]|nr:sulfatase [Thermoplasmata archaeon]
MKDVVLLTVDALRARNLHCYGNERETSPRIDAIARKGALFERAYSQGSLTTLAFPALFGGIHTFAAERIERRSVSPTLVQYAFPPYFPSLPELFRSAGYRTGGFHSNALLSHHYGYERGFDIFYDGLENKFQVAHRRRWAVSHFLRRYPRLYRNALYIRDALGPMRPGTLSDRLNAMALEHVDGGEGPFFLWLHYMDVHHPMLPSPEVVREVTGRRMGAAEITHLNRLKYYGERTKTKRADDLMAVYDASIREVDVRIGALLDGLEERGRLTDAVVAVTSDHGEAFMEHGALAHPIWNFHDEQLHVPLVIKGLPTGRERCPVGHVDVAPTLMSLAGLDPSPDFLGRMMPHDEGVVFSGGRVGGGSILAITTARWRFIWRIGKDDVELYDLEADPEERKDLSASKREAVEGFKGLGTAHLGRVERKRIDLKMRMGHEAIGAGAATRVRQ